MTYRLVLVQPRPIAIVILAFLATGLLPAPQNVPTKKETAPKVTEELVHVQTSDGITNGGAMFAPAVSVREPDRGHLDPRVVTEFL